MLANEMCSLSQF